MINKVIICGIRRAGNLVPEMEIKQMAGRCLRTYDTSKSGEVILITDNSDVENAKKYLFGELPSVYSQMGELDNLAFHILPSIYSKEVYDDVSAYDWYRRTLSFFQGITFSYEKLMNLLLSCESVEYDGKNFNITEIGKLSCKYYFSPLRIKKWKDQFQCVVNRERYDDVMLSWAFATMNLDMYVYGELYNNYVGELECLRVDDMYSYESFVFFCLLRGYKPKDLKFLINEYRDDIERIGKLLISVSELLEWGIEKIMKQVICRIKHRVTDEFAEIMCNMGLENRNIAAKLIDIGITDSETLINGKDIIERYGDETLVNWFKENYE